MGSSAGATLVSAPTTLPSTTISAPTRRPVALDVGDAAQEAVHVAAAVDAAHQLLAEEAALGERHRVVLEERLLRDRRVVDVDGLHAGSPARCATPRTPPGRRSASTVAAARRRAAGRRGRSPTRCRSRWTRRRARVDARSPRRSDARDSMPELAGAVDDLGLHADPEPVERRRELRAEAGIAVEPRLVADAQQAERRRRACPAA